MAKDVDGNEFERLNESSEAECDRVLEGDFEPTCELGTKSDANSQQEIWRPEEAKFCKAIAEHYGVNRKTVQIWWRKIEEAYPWLSERDLKNGDQYTPLCIRLMGEYQAAVRQGLKIDNWKRQVQEQNPDEYEAWLKVHQPQTTQPKQPETVEAELEPDSTTDLTLPAAALSPIAGMDRLSLARQALEQNNQELALKLSNIQQRLNQHNKQQTANEQGFDINLQNRKAQLLMKVAEQAIADKLEADQLYSAIVNGQLDLTPKQPGNAPTAVS